MTSAYSGSTLILATKHAKSSAIAPAMWKHLEASVLECVVDTDQLGTFSGEIERQGNALNCARRKCEWAAELLGNKADHFIASEGSFGPHPVIPFVACDQEILYFMDRKRCFHLHIVHASEKTNYQMKTVGSLKELDNFANSALFPSHALTLRPNDKSVRGVIFKGIVDRHALHAAFKAAQQASPDRRVWVETDMRAHLNPSRMSVIAELADKLALRLASHCPSCQMPGWGIVRLEKGLPCEYCGNATDLVAREILGCVSCTKELNLPRADGVQSAQQVYCPFCNP